MKQVLPRVSILLPEKDGTGTAAPKERRSVVRNSLTPSWTRKSELETSDKLAFSGVAHTHPSMDRPVSFQQRRRLKEMQEQQDLDADNDGYDGQLLPSASRTSQISRKSQILNLSSSSMGIKRFSAARFFHSRRRQGGECCARRGCTCNAPDPYTVSPGEMDDLVAINEKTDDAASENQPRLPFSAESSTSSWRSSTLSVRSELSWTKLYAKVVGSHVPMPPNSPPEHSPRRRHLSQQAGRLLGKRMKLAKLAGQAGDSLVVAAEEGRTSLMASGEEASLRRSFFGKRASMAPGITGGEEDNDHHRGSMARASIARISLFNPVESSANEANWLGRSDMKNIAHQRIMRMQDRLNEKRQGGLLQRRYENLPDAEKEFLETVFVRFDVDCSGSLDWEEVTACLRELGLSGTNTLEKREVLRVCRDALKVAQVQHSEMMDQRQVSAQAKLRQHRQAQFVRKEDRRKVRPVRKGLSSVKVATASTESEDTNKINHFEILAFDRLHIDDDDDAEVTKVMIPNKMDRATAQSDSEDGRSGSEDHDADADSCHSFSSGECFDFFSFAVLVVPRVRQLLRELHSSKVSRYFCHFDRDGVGSLPVPKCQEIGRCLNLDPIILAHALDNNKGKNHDCLDFAAFEKSVMTCMELAARGMRRRENAILDKIGIPYELFESFRDDIVQIYEAFKVHSRWDGGEEDYVMTATNAFNALRPLGFHARSFWEKEHLQGLLSKAHREDQGFSDIDEETDIGLQLADHPELTFEQFLRYLQRVRSFFKSRQVDTLRAIFDRFDKDRSNTLSVAEVSLLLEELDILPRSRREQEELGQLIQSVDEDGNGVLDFVEFQELVNRIEEKFASMRYEEEVECALARGFDEVQVSEFRAMFELIDVDNSETLDSNEVRQALTAMSRTVNCQDFEQAWKKLDADGSGSLDFLEFIDLMKMLRDGTGMFAEDAAKLPAFISHLDHRVLRVLLGQLNFSHSYLRCLDQQDLVDIACTSFGMEPREPFCERLDLHSLADLFEYVRKLRDKAKRTIMPGGR